MDNMKLVEALQRASAFLSKVEGQRVSAERLFRDYKNWTLTELLLNQHAEVPQNEWLEIMAVMDKMLAGMPYQYALGRAYFMDEAFVVTPATLIPRPETEGLLQLAGDYIKKKPTARVLDIGTGSGIIAIMLKKLFPTISVVASDISPSALEIARENAHKHEVDISFIESDLFEYIEGAFDLIVSNPPYIGEDEKKAMDPHVLAYEPHTALFSEEEGYALYYKIGQQLAPYLEKKGQVIFEIGYRQGAVLKAYYEGLYPRAEVKVMQDFQNLDRYLVISFGKGGEQHANI